jgi:hypothetical protein
MHKHSTLLFHIDSDEWNTPLYLIFVNIVGELENVQTL